MLDFAKIASKEPKGDLEGIAILRLEITLSGLLSSSGASYTSESAGNHFISTCIHPRNAFQAIYQLYEQYQSMHMHLEARGKVKNQLENG